MQDIRNIAIIAHVDHGKTTIVDRMIYQARQQREQEKLGELILDNNDLERERGITILAKNVSVLYKGVKINVIDTPGHSDFGGEVERVLNMADGVILLVDAFEGCMPQTRFVLQKALELGHKLIVVVNKIDKPDARIDEVMDEVLELLLDLDATNEQLDSPVLFCSGRDGTASLVPHESGENLVPLFEKVIEHIPAPEGEIEDEMQVLVSSIDYNEYVGRIGIGRVERGIIKQNQEVIICDWHNSKQPYKSKVVNLYQIEGLKREAVIEAKMGDIICFSGVGDITIGDTLCSVNCPKPLPFVKISEPTVEMTFAVNDSPFAGQDGKFITSRQLRERLYRELLKDVSLRVADTDSTDAFRVCGRGEMHLSILIETMRREGYEFQVSAPKVLLKEIDGVKMEPMEEVSCDVPQEYMGSVIEKLGARKGELIDMSPRGDRMHVVFHIPTRGLFGYRNEFLTDTRGEGIINSLFLEYTPYRGEITKRTTGSLVAYETGKTTSYGIYNVQDRGQMFVVPAQDIYEGQIVGENAKTDDIVVNPCKKKHMTAVRSTGADEALRLVPCKRMSLEQAIEFIADDELMEVTPLNIRIRKRILDNNLRQKARNK
jgi:GTP-binding protein